MKFILLIKSVCKQCSDVTINIIMATPGHLHKYRLIPKLKSKLIVTHKSS